MSRGRHLLGAGAPGFSVLLVLAVVPLLLSSVDEFTGITAASAAIVILSLGLVTGRVGMLSLGQMGFAAVGAYVLMWMQAHASGVPFFADVAIAGAVTAPVGLLIGIPALRLRGVNLAVITLAFAVTVAVAITVNNFPGASSGLIVARPSLVLSDRSYLWFCGAVFAALALLLSFASKTRLGASWAAVRNSERGAAALGQSVAQAKMSAFVLSGFIAGVGGALIVGQLGTVTIDSFQPATSLVFFAVAVMMGARYPEGALIGGALSGFLPTILADIGIAQSWGQVLFAFGAVAGLKGGAGAAEALRLSLHQRFAPKPPSASLARTRMPPAPAPRSNGTGGGGADQAPALEVIGMTVEYGHVIALDDVSLSVPVGSVVGLIGPNGAGKTTLIDGVTGFLSSYRGEVRLAGESMERLVAHRRAQRGLRRTFQQDRTVPDLTIAQYVQLSASRGGRGRVEIAELAMLLEFFGCPDGRYRVGDLDAGTRRLIEVVAAVGAKPHVALLDEPAAGLAHADSEELARRIAAIPERFGPAVLVVEHDMDLVRTACSDVTVLDFGKVIARGTPSAVLADSTVVRAYLGEEVAV